MQSRKGTSGFASTGESSATCASRADGIAIRSSNPAKQSGQAIRSRNPVKQSGQAIRSSNPINALPKWKAQVHICGPAEDSRRQIPATIHSRAQFQVVVMRKADAPQALEGASLVRNPPRPKARVARGQPTGAASRPAAQRRRSCRSTCPPAQRRQSSWQ